MNFELLQTIQIKLVRHEKKFILHVFVQHMFFALDALKLQAIDKKIAEFKFYLPNFILHHIYALLQICLKFSQKFCNTGVGTSSLYVIPEVTGSLAI